MWRPFGGLSAGRGKGRMGEKVQELRSIMGRYKIDRGVLGIGNGDIKEPIRTTHGHKLGGAIAGGKLGTRRKWAKGGKLGQL